MSEEDQNVEVVPSVKSDMHSYSSTMTAKDVKALAFKHNIPLDLSVSTYRVDSADPVRAILRVGPGSGGKILNETFSGLKWWKKSFFFLDRRAIPQAMAWRHHDSDIHDPLPTDGFHASDVVTLTNQSIDIRPVPSGLLFHAGLATTWEFSGFLPVFKDTEGNVVTMSEYLRFPFLDGATIEQGDALSARDAITQRTTGPLPVNQSLPEKTARLKEVEISLIPKNCGSKGEDEESKVVYAVRAEEEDSTEEDSSASPLKLWHQSLLPAERCWTMPGISGVSRKTNMSATPFTALNPEKTLSKNYVPVDDHAVELSLPSGSCLRFLKGPYTVRFLEWTISCGMLGSC
ncbi:hypothetical protein Tco_0497649 [Tanacetum coccineum]